MNLEKEQRAIQYLKMFGPESEGQMDADTGYRTQIKGRVNMVNQNIDKKIRMICDDCDYAPALCDGHPLMCEYAQLRGWNSEKGCNSGNFEAYCAERELK